MSQFHKDVAEKRKIMRELYGGLMTAEDLQKEFGMRADQASALMKEKGFGVLIGKRIKFDTDLVAKYIVEKRGMA